MACNGLAGAGQGGIEIAPTNNEKYFTLEQAEVVSVNKDVAMLISDFEVLIGLAEVKLGLSCEEALWGQTSAQEVS